MKLLYNGFFVFFCFFLLTSCKNDSWNNPQDPKGNSNKIIYYSSFSAPPKTLDPARSYSSDEAIFTAQIYEPPLQYQYLLRPYQLVPLTAFFVPEPEYYDKNGRQLPNNVPAAQVAYTLYNITIKPGVFYQPHPAFAKDKKGNFYYHHLTSAKISEVSSVNDFKHTGTRELIAADYVYEIKRLADPKVQSPIFGVMSEHIAGLADYAKQLELIQQNNPGKFLNLTDYNFPGAKVTGRYSYQIKIMGKYQQFIYWLAMPFFAPIPWEVDYFYSQPGMAKKNLTLDWYPVGTGPYMLVKNNPNNEMVLAKNNNFHGEIYPLTGAPGDKEKGLLINAGKPLPFVDEFVFSLEKESIPRWNKFLQGYYDQSGIAADNFDQTIRIDPNGNPYLTPEMQKRKLQLTTSVAPSIFYLGFNMLDDVVGGYSERAQKLRQAISIVMDFDEFVSIFLNGRGIVAQGPIPPGIFGYVNDKTAIDPYVYDFKNGAALIKPLKYAKQLLAEAGYPDGRDIKSGQQLILSLDVPISGGTEDQAQFQWVREQFAKLGIELEIRATQYNRFQEKMRTGNDQIYFWGWNADYPDPENFLFLLYGPNGKVKYGGENASNYANPEFDKLFEQMKDMPNNSEREKIIQTMLLIAQKDAPWVWGFYPKNYVLSQQWVYPEKPSGVINNTLKYVSINVKLRALKQKEWNQPILWPIMLVVVFFILILIPVIWQYWQKEHRSVEKIRMN